MPLGGVPRRPDACRACLLTLYVLLDCYQHSTPRIEPTRSGFARVIRSVGCARQPMRYENMQESSSLATSFHFKSFVRLEHGFRPMFGPTSKWGSSIRYLGHHWRAQSSDRHREIFRAPSAPSSSHTGSPQLNNVSYRKPYLAPICIAEPGRTVQQQSLTAYGLLQSISPATAIPWLATTIPAQEQDAGDPGILDHDDPKVRRRGDARQARRV